MISLSEVTEDILDYTTDEIYVQNPCKVVKVNGNYVDVLLYINDEEPDQIIYNVPVIRPAETQRAYIFLGIKEGDRGICRFFDRSTEAYLQSDFDYNSDDRQHDINDRCFELGFIPNAEAFVYPTDQEIEIGLKNKKFILSVNDNGTVNLIAKDDVTITVDKTVNLTAETVNLTATTVNSKATINHTGNIIVTGDVIASGISLQHHTHIGNLGAPTSEPQ